MIEYLSTASLFIGTALCCIGAMGVLRMPDFMNRFHSSTIITTLGTFFLVLPVALFGIGTGEPGYVRSAILLLLAAWVTGAVGSHAMARAMFMRGIKPGNLVKDQTGERP